MKLLVTGAAGFIGSHFVEAAEAAGHQVAAVDLLTYAGRSANLPEGYPLIKADICDRVMMDALFCRERPDAVIHLAAESHVARSIESRDEFLRTNVTGTLVLLEAAMDYWRTDKAKAFRFLHVSTDEVYGSLGPTDAPWTEESPYAPNNPYAASKAASDHLVRSYFKTFGLPAIITHSSNNYGPRQHPEKLIPALVRQALDGGPLKVHGDGMHVRDWLHVTDHCQGLLAAIEHGQPGEVYNFGGECERNNLMVAELVRSCMATACGCWPEIELTADRPGNDRRYSTNTFKARMLGWAPGSMLGARIAETVRWYLDHPIYDLDYGR